MNIHERYKQLLIEGMQTPEQIAIVNKLVSTDDLQKDESWFGLIGSKLSDIDSPQ